MTIDQEFKSLLPPLSTEEFKQLESNCLKEGIRDSLVVWDNNGEWILIDGHNRYEIAQKHGLPYNQKRMTFPSREAVIEWIILNQDGRRNLSAYDRSLLALKLKPVIVEKAKERMQEGAKGTQISAEAKGETRDKLAKIAKVSHDTIHKVEVIQQKASEEIKQKLKSGEISIHEGYRQTVNKSFKSPAVQKREYIEQMQEQHKAYEDQKNNGIISLEDAREDKENKKFLATELSIRLLKMGNAIDGIYIDSKEDQSFIEIVEALDQTQKDAILESIRHLYSELQHIEEVLNGKTANHGNC